MRLSPSTSRRSRCRTCRNWWPHWRPRMYLPDTPCKPSHRCRSTCRCRTWGSWTNTRQSLMPFPRHNWCKPSIPTRTMCQPHKYRTCRCSWRRSQRSSIRQGTTCTVQRRRPPRCQGCMRRSTHCWWRHIRCNACPPDRLSSQTHRCQNSSQGCTARRRCCWCRVRCLRRRCRPDTPCTSFGPSMPGSSRSCMSRRTPSCRRQCRPTPCRLGIPCIRSVPSMPGTCQTDTPCSIQGLSPPTPCCMCRCRRECTSPSRNTTSIRRRTRRNRPSWRRSSRCTLCRRDTASSCTAHRHTSRCPACRPSRQGSSSRWPEDWRSIHPSRMAHTTGSSRQASSTSRHNTEHTSSRHCTWRNRQC